MLYVSANGPIKELRLSETPEGLFEYQRKLRGDSMVYGLSAFMCKLMAEDIPRTAAGKHNVLITGETGSGKEAVADQIAKQAGMECFPVNCAAIPRDRFEAELFGWTKGAFTGAVNENEGILSKADGKLLFLDELGDVPKSVQAKMLRLVQGEPFHRLGDPEPKEVTARLCAATNRQENLREDIKWRFAEHIHMSPLRDRIADVLFIMEGVLDHRKSTDGMPQSARWVIAPDTLIRLLLSPWRGNVRELRNVIELSISEWEFRGDQGNDILLCYHPTREACPMLCDIIAMEKLWDCWRAMVARAVRPRAWLPKSRIKNIEATFAEVGTGSVWIPQLAELQYRERIFANNGQAAPDGLFTCGEALRFAASLADEYTRSWLAGEGIGDKALADSRGLTPLLGVVDTLNGCPHGVLLLPADVAAEYHRDCTRKEVEDDPVGLTRYGSKDDLLRDYFGQWIEHFGGPEGLNKHGCQTKVAQATGVSSKGIDRELTRLGVKAQKRAKSRKTD